MATNESSNGKRLATPSLFVPPSRNVSSPDLTASDRPAARRTPTSSRVPLLRQRSTIETSPTAQDPRETTHKAPSQDSRQTRKASTTSQTWAELQNTLEEVELSAASGSNVFGADHTRALEELRKAQVELARAWARGEEGEQQGDETDDEEGLSIHKERKHQGMRETTAVLAADRSERVGAGPKQRAAEFSTKKTQLEEETENDITLARKRRLANDRYFERVNKGVVDVVAKLEVVADKMGQVELESQEIWGERDSLDTNSMG